MPRLDRLVRDSLARVRRDNPLMPQPGGSANQFQARPAFSMWLAPKPARLTFLNSIPLGEPGESDPSGHDIIIRGERARIGLHKSDLFKVSFGGT